MGSSLNLIPYPRRMRERNSRLVRLAVQTNVAYLVLMLALVCTVVIPTSTDGADADPHEKQKVTSADELLLLQSRVRQAEASLRQQQLQYEGSQTLHRRVPWATLLRLLAQTASPDVQLTALRVKLSNPANPERAEVELSGLTADPYTMSQFVLRLERLGLFEAVQLVESSREPAAAGAVTRLRVRCVIDAALPQGGMQ